MYQSAMRPAWAEINLTNLDYNIKNIIDKVGSRRQVIGVVKADGYGHGAVETVNVLKENGIESFAVATLPEAINLRKAGVTEEIIMLGLTSSLYADILVEYDLTPVVCDSENAEAFSNAAEKAGKEVNGMIVVDTGMGRIGYQVDDPAAISDIKKIQGLPNFNIQGLFSHFATSDAADKTFAKEQEDKFNAFYDKLIAWGVKFPMKTLANSAAVMEIPSVHFDSVRPGIILYGCYPSAEVDKSELSIKPVMSVKANIVHLKKVPKGTSISYGQRFVTKRESLIATLSLGYADGLPRPYSTKGKVIINGTVAPLAGTICMDQCMADVTDVPDVKVGDEVIIMGSDGTNTISADDIAKATGTISYEILCAFGQRLPKVYIR